MDDGEREDAEIERRSQVMARAIEHGALGRRDKPDDKTPADGSKLEGDGR